MFRTNSHDLSNPLPRLLYAGDVPVEATVGGSLLLYRLLFDYPPERLRILESTLHVSSPATRLNGVGYDMFFIGDARWLRTRLRKTYSAWLVLSAKRAASTLVRIARECRAEAILTVSHGFSWFAAAAAANRLNLPLHLVAHDDWLQTLALPEWLHPWAERRFKAVYRQAASRFCVSPYMEEEYRRACGVPGEVLYPSRKPETDSSPVVDRSTRRVDHRIVFGYAGSIHSSEYLCRLISLAEILLPLGCSVRIYSPSRLPSETLPANLEWSPPIPSDEVVARLGLECDVLFVPMAFEPQHAANMRVCFPSKVADYTATGLPLLIWGPAYASANRWAREEDGSAEIVETEEIAAVRASVQLLVTDAAYRRQLGERAAQRGETCFSHRAVTGRFHAALRRVALADGL